MRGVLFKEFRYNTYMYVYNLGDHNCLLLQVLIKDVKAHKENMEQLESATNAVITLVDDSDQSELGSRLWSVLLRYRCHDFGCHAYPVDRWLDDRSLELSVVCPCAVLTSDLQVHTITYTLIRFSYMYVHVSSL